MLQGDSMAYQIDAADANVVLNPFVTAAAQKYQVVEGGGKKKKKKKKRKKEG